MRDHNKLIAFQFADDLAIQIYQITKFFPKDEMFGLTSQMRRAAVSVASNIVEGCARESQNEYVRFLEIAFGSLKELHYQYSLAFRLGFVKKTEDENIVQKFEETEKVLSSLIRTFRKPKV